MIASANAVGLGFGETTSTCRPKFSRRKSPVVGPIDAIRARGFSLVCVDEPVLDSVKCSRRIGVVNSASEGAK